MTASPRFTRRTITDQVTEDLRARILTGDFPAGHQLRPRPQAAPVLELALVRARLRRELAVVAEHGRVYAWGCGAGHQLGIGSMENELLPRAVPATVTVLNLSHNEIATVENLDRLAALTRLDLRQESERHAEALDAITAHLGLGSYLEWDEAKKVEWLGGELAPKRPLLPAALPCSERVQEVLDTFHVVAGPIGWRRRSFSSDGGGTALLGDSTSTMSRCARGVRSIHRPRAFAFQ